jgi:hypothetical protein
MFHHQEKKIEERAVYLVFNKKDLELKKSQNAQNKRISKKFRMKVLKWKKVTLKAMIHYKSQVILLVLVAKVKKPIIQE